MVDNRIAYENPEANVVERAEAFDRWLEGQDKDVKLVAELHLEELRRHVRGLSLNGAKELLGQVYQFVRSAKYGAEVCDG